MNSWLTTEFSIEEVTTDRLSDLSDSWINLWSKIPETTPFQTPFWNLKWWKHYGRGRSFVLVLKKKSDVVGIAPFFIDEDPTSRQRVLQFLGTGISDYLDVLVEDPSHIHYFMYYLAEHKEAWDVCDFQSLKRTSNLLQAKTAPHFNDRIFVSEQCSGIKISCSMPTEIFEQKFKKKYDYCVRYAHRHGNLSLEKSDEKLLPSFLESFFRIHQKRWTLKGMPSSLAETKAQNFFLEISQEFLRERLLHFYALKLNEAIIATLYAFAQNGRIYYYLMGFDPEYGHLSPGTLMLGTAMERAVQEQFQYIDFMRGEESYKKRWRIQAQPLLRRVIST